ncbi:MAG: 3-oxoacyl-ACP synthase [Prevotellaceae bacterium]|jgi:3-oxoacyl-[acyl-carrier-protein] synthase-1|nr:3-oxoacyl-ACP synthase [Prevotellaceae bacterium]
MLNISGTNIISSLGFSSDENFENVLAGKSGLRHYGSGIFDLPEPFVASLIDRERLNVEFNRHCGRDNYNFCLNENTFTDLEKAAMLSVHYANEQAKIDLASERTLFVISTTKGNVDKLTVNNKQFTIDGQSNCELYLWHSAKTVSQFFGNKNMPVVVSNACISGAAAQIAALRELESGNFDFAVVVGVDFLSKFIISGFQSFKALSAEPCKPFDSRRNGLNLGEAAATMIFSNYKSQISDYGLLAGAIRNDANHISAPSRTGEGSLHALNSILGSPLHILDSQLAFVNAHGTATPYNDAMEMVAIERAGLQNVPTNSLKTYFGHTLGAAGVVESIISLIALERGVVLPINNEHSTIHNVQCPINLSQTLQKTDKLYFVKMLSGFGGVNAALLFGKIRNEYANKNNLHISGQQDIFIKKEINLSFKNAAEITDLYRSSLIDYPKFFKMDNLSKMGFVAAEMMLKDEQERFAPREDFGVICFNRSSSLQVDTQYQSTIQSNDNYFPSPLLFVYTLPNIVAGEIALRNKFLGETSFYVCQHFEAVQIERIVRNTFSDPTLNEVLVAWVEAFDGIFEIKMRWLARRKIVQ